MDSRHAVWIQFQTIPKFRELGSKIWFQFNLFLYISLCFGLSLSITGARITISRIQFKRKPSSCWEGGLPLNYLLIFQFYCWIKSGQLLAAFSESWFVELQTEQLVACTWLLYMNACQTRFLFNTVSHQKLERDLPSPAWGNLFCFSEFVASKSLASYCRNLTLQGWWKSSTYYFVIIWKFWMKMPRVHCPHFTLADKAGRWPSTKNKRVGNYSETCWIWKTILWNCKGASD